MLDVQDKAKKVKGEDAAPKSASVTNNNLFVGSTKDLLRAINAEKIIEQD